MNVERAPELAALTVVCIPAALIVVVLALPIVGVGMLHKRARRCLRMRGVL